MMMLSRLAFCNPYINSQAERYRKHFVDLYGKGIATEKEFLAKLASKPEQPDIMMFWCFCQNRAAIMSQCRERGINMGFWEDGFFPHYKTLHFDPLGFCWESSLTRMVFRGVSERQRARAGQTREEWLHKPARALPDGVKKPFVLWPLQLTGDQVNLCDLAVSDWTGLLQHFRAALPAGIQLVVKDHPVARERDIAGLDALLPRMQNTIRVSKQSDLKALLRECAAVAGANSTVLSEARLMFQKPAYAYGRSWFTNHHELFLPLRLDVKGSLPRVDWLEDSSRMRTAYLDDYSDWFLAQLLGRQLESSVAESDPAKLKQKMGRLSYRSFVEYGEEIFDDD